jgi:Protein of unknown function (DUF2568)
MVREDVVVETFTRANAVLRFPLELCMLAAFAYWGSRAADSTVANVAIAVAAPTAAVAVWAVFMAPRSKRRLPEPRRIPLEIALFGLATAALADADRPGLAVAFGVFAAVNTTLVHLLGEI